MHQPLDEAVRLAERAAAYAAQHDIGRAHGSYDDLLEDPLVEAVYISLPNSLHHPWTMRALAAGKHVLVEKPLCLDLQEADRLVDLARRTSVTAMVGFNLRFHRHLCAARKAVAGGLLGQVELVRTTWSSQVRRQVGRGDVVVVCGPSGSGKSPLCRAINRLETIESGTISIDGTASAISAIYFSTPEPTL